MSDTEEFRERVAAVVHSWKPLAERVSVEFEDSHFWRLQPTAPQASPLWVAGYAAWDLTVGFGRASARIELGYSAKTSAEEELAMLDKIGRSVMTGRLTEWRRGRNGSRWRLSLPDGTVMRGSTNWLLPLPWQASTEERFGAY